MKIKNIKKLRSGKYQILLENNEKITTYDEVLLKNNLLYKKDLMTSDIDEINKNNSYYDVYNKVIKLISNKIRSENEIKNYIKKFSLSLNDQNKIIKDLKDKGILNDINYIKACISDRVYLSNDGPYKIRKDLINQKLDESIIDNELTNIDNNYIKEKLIKLINKKVKISKGSNYMAKQKILNNMYNLGYSKDLINECFNFELNEDENLMKDFNKIYKDVIRKEIDESRIYLKVKQKLYQKGYQISQIDKVIEDNKKENY